VKYDNLSARNELKNWKKVVSSRLIDLVTSWSGQEKGISDAIIFSVSNPGKLLRPLLMMGTVKTFGRDPIKFIDAACAIELVHIASLILDDLPCMDNCNIRRGRPSLHLQSGETIAILTSISLLAAAFHVLAETEQTYSPRLEGTALKAISVLTAAIGPRGMVGGQYTDLEKNIAQLSNKDIKEVLRQKTATLFVAAVEIGAILGGANNREEYLLKTFAENIGVAFQIIDDLSEVGQDIIQKQKGLNFACKAGRMLAEKEASQLIKEGYELLHEFGDAGNELFELTHQIELLIQ
jgi:geranylgeranyl diphosphate synthase type II